ncbi:uncharacterized protein TRIVIDRAFT_46209 [Trichoderma virens Gv29-8]|uniref:3-carboxymuconate cyclase n=1 Tax=Hypocrea virens (strain Gv29-8 / FGSC 10586) TaxID=413071 RepID=G9N0U7_HYPVG|nr:uncharacterized protein TRIVIDRAFT_46209 [Trichoderma virens Gv29-8]EHK19380.1 hypothetical protein TRIVIDRAFT_46209 [Trichoderma virens Gv29-8]UKZ58357.1 hypothetical protein TrVGV298_012225 [Trichoderma virens]
MKGFTISLYLLALNMRLSSAVPRPQYPDGAELYFLEDNPEGSSVVSISIGRDGKLSQPHHTATGGKGFGIQGSNGELISAGLHSQDALVVDGPWLLTLNSGSNTVSLFQIPEHDPARPVLTGKPISTGGEYPNTVALSARHRLACVVNSGAIPGLQCYSISKTGSLEPLGKLKPLQVNEPTPPPGAPGTVSDIVFNPSQTAIFITVKGDGSNNNTTPGYIYAFPLINGVPSDKPVISRPPQLHADFALTFISDRRAAIADTSFGAALLDISSDFKVSVSRTIEVIGQKATCWIKYVPEYDVVFLGDGGVSNITALDARSGDIKYVVPFLAEAGGSFDFAFLGNFLYTRRGNSAVSVIDLQDSNKKGDQQLPKIVELYNTSSLGAAANFNGMAIFSY